MGTRKLDYTTKDNVVYINSNGWDYARIMAAAQTEPLYQVECVLLSTEHEPYFPGKVHILTKAALDYTLDVADSYNEPVVFKAVSIETAAILCEFPQTLDDVIEVLRAWELVQG